MRVTFTENALAEYISWQQEDKKTIKRIGKPEPLKSRKAFSRRIDDANRLVYLGDSEQNLVILSCKGHYED